MKKTLISEVAGAFVLDINRYADNRGYFQEVYSVAKDQYPLSCYQINVSYSHKGVVRGMHVVPFAKLCTCVRGSLFDVVADVRPDSATFLHWYGVWLTEENHRQLFIPANCAHGFFAAEDNTILLYLQDGTYAPNTEREINWQDPQLGIKWPVVEEYILSDKDRQAPMFEL